ncbi:MAG: cobalt/nickel transport system permease protein [Desulfovibrionales bacterium]|nr:cobalt/nickel transport system permease protein [Desulfovibrionales bacterium]
MSGLEEPFALGDTFLHKADPRYKLASAAVLSVAVAVGQTWMAPLAGLGIGVCLAGLARLQPSRLARRLLAVNGFILFLCLVVPVTTPGEAVWSIGPLTATREGLRLAGLTAVKSNAILLILMALAATSTTAAVGKGLDGLGLPKSLTWILLLCYRYAHVILAEQRRLARAAALRGFQPKTNRHTYTTYANMVGMTLVRSYERSQRVSQAMVLRGFDGSFRSLEQAGASRRDRLLFACCLAAALVLAWIEIKTRFFA